MPVVKVSVVQACTASYGSPDSVGLTLAKLEQFTALAKQRDGSQLAVFPEALCVSVCQHNTQASDPTVQHRGLSIVRPSCPFGTANPI